MRRKHILSALLLFFIATPIQILGQEVDTIRVGDVFKNFDHLPMGSMQYLVYSERGDMQRIGVIMNTNTERISHEGKEYISISHVWNAAEQKNNGSFYSLVKPGTFEPIIHIRKSEAKGTEAYGFSEKELVALDTVENNSEAGYSLELDQPIFNFEIDLETFSLLPLKENYKAALNFFHPGSTFSGPQWYLIEVIGSEELTLPGGEKVDTWILYMDYNGRQPTRFWYTKKNQEFIKMIADYNGTKIYKTRLF